jgi:hypothetical protein
MFEAETGAAGGVDCTTRPTPRAFGFAQLALRQSEQAPVPERLLQGPVRASLEPVQRRVREAG